MPAISVRDLSKSLNGFYAVDMVSFDVEEGGGPDEERLKAAAYSSFGKRSVALPVVVPDGPLA